MDLHWREKCLIKVAKVTLANHRDTPNPIHMTSTHVHTLPHANLAASMLKCPRNHPLPLGKVKTSYQTPRAHPPSELALQPQSPIQGPAPASLNTHTLFLASVPLHMLSSQLFSSWETPIHPSRPQATHHAIVIYSAPAICQAPSQAPRKPQQTKQAESCPPGVCILELGSHKENKRSGVKPLGRSIRAGVLTS